VKEEFDSGKLILSSRRLLKALVFPCNCTVCGGSLLNILIEEQQRAFWTDDIPADCK